MYELLKQIVRSGIKSELSPGPDENLKIINQRLHEGILKQFGRSLAIRHIDTGSCNACELEIHALNNPYYNLEGLGIHFVASPRHADMLLVTGPVSRHMETALLRTYEAIPDPKLVVTVGDCSCSRGPFDKNYATIGSVSRIIPVDVALPGCPPSPRKIMSAILTAIQIKKPEKNACIPEIRSFQPESDA
ncbi:MAG TPA: NADH-quinone oxidoreductase subunit NuoB [Burkholderiales bacterium]|nr:NADH-quinone oxidoreductase subunit NuoB [Burkholderiales bacterium]